MCCPSSHETIEIGYSGDQFRVTSPTLEPAQRRISFFTDGTPVRLGEIDLQSANPAAARAELGAPDPVKTEKVCGKFVGISGSRVCLKKTTQGDELKQVRDFRFRGLPAQCSNGVKPKVAGKRAKIDGDGKRFRSRRLSILGNFSGVQAKAAGKLKGDGKKIRGEVRVRFRNDADARCDTRARKFKAS